jgi:hypothetical protein
MERAQEGKGQEQVEVGEDEEVEAGVEAVVLGLAQEDTVCVLTVAKGFLTK